MSLSPPSERSAVPAGLGGLLALALAMGIGRFVYTPLLPSMALSLGLGHGMAGAIASANFAGYLFGALAAASPALAGAPRRWLALGLAGSALTTALMAAVSMPAALMAVRFAGGAASALVLVFASSIVLETLARAGRPGLGALHFSGVGLGILASSAFVAAAGDWRQAWLVCGLASGAAALAAFRLIGPADAADAVPARVASPPDDADRPAGPQLRRLVLAYGLFGLGYVVTATFLVALVRESATGLPELFAWAVVGVCAAPSVLAWNRAARRLGLCRAFALACLAEAAGVALSVAATGPLGALAAAACLGATFMGITALGLSAARRLSPGDPRRVLAAMTAAFGVGQMAGPLIAGLAADVFGSLVLPTLAAALALVAAAGLTVRLDRTTA